ncbi:MAG: nucleotidyl transferase AbiEii/AbiGii toxin family protein [bacterium]|nr:nucleotidyl transferase AbiEii/AbiGii toxin family protein [bacterium]
MDFERVLTSVATFIRDRGQPWALIGGLGMAAFGMQRTTFDLDLVVPGEVQDDLIGFLESSGYSTLHRSSGYSNHVHDDPEMGRVDLVYVRGDTQRLMFRDLPMIKGPGGAEVPVLRPEHLAAMKVFAIKNDPSRTLRELADIQFLLTLPGVDHEEVRGYFLKHGLEDRFDELKKSL